KRGRLSARERLQDRTSRADVHTRHIEPRFGSDIVRIIQIRNFDHLPGEDVPLDLSGGSDVPQIIDLKRQTDDIAFDTGAHPGWEFQSQAARLEDGWCDSHLGGS